MNISLGGQAPQTPYAGFARLAQWAPGMGPGPGLARPQDGPSIVR
jgi:hypothetical protein